jgi:small subunit ribosomal protein S2
MIDFRELIKAGAHFGHQTSRWCPKMDPYLWGSKNNVHLIDVSKTAIQLEKAANFLESVVADGGQILWIGTKRPAQAIIHEAAVKTDMPYVNHRWIGGTLSNYSQVKKSVTKLLHYEDILARAEKFTYYTKKEMGEFQKMVSRLSKSVGGIRTLNWPIGALVVVDVLKEQSAIQEAHIMGVPVVALVDTNGDPSLVDYVIPANDDAPKSIQVVIDYLVQAVAKGKVAAQVKSQAAREVKKEKREEATRSKEKEEGVKASGTEPKRVAPTKTAAAKEKDAADEQTVEEKA